MLSANAHLPSKESEDEGPSAGLGTRIKDQLFSASLLGNLSGGSLPAAEGT